MPMRIPAKPKASAVYRMASAKAVGSNILFPPRHLPETYVPARVSAKKYALVQLSLC